MFFTRFLGQRHVHSSRPVQRRRFEVETLEGRQLLSTMTTTNVNPPVNMIQGGHIGTNIA